jgi:hypothetical protein
MTTIHLQTRQSEDTPTASTGGDISSSTYGFSSPWGWNYPNNTNPSTMMRVHLVVYGLDAGATVQFTIESSLNNFETLVQHATCFLTGPFGATSHQGDEGYDEGEATSFPVNPQHFVWGPNDQNIAAIPFGQSSATLRVNLVAINGGYVDYEAWFTY